MPLRSTLSAVVWSLMRRDYPRAATRNENTPWGSPPGAGYGGRVIDDVERVHPDDRAAWRAWLAENHTAKTGVWLVTWRQGAGMPVLTYDDAVLEALAVGWVDSKGRALDERRTMLYVAPRRSGSSWSRPNKRRIERLRAAGWYVMQINLDDLNDPEELVARIRSVLDSRPVF